VVSAKGTFSPDITVVVVVGSEACPKKKTEEIQKLTNKKERGGWEKVEEKEKVKEKRKTKEKPKLVIGQNGNQLQLSENYRFWMKLASQTNMKK